MIERISSFPSAPVLVFPNCEKIEVNGFTKPAGYHDDALPYVGETHDEERAVLQACAFFGKV